VTTYVPRLIDDVLAEVLAQRAAVMVNGPRACGKTTSGARLARSIVRLDVGTEAALFRADPDAALAAFGERPLLLDEWQEVPEVIGAVKRAVDAGAPAGSFILTGSVRAPIEQRTWPGTGRVATVEMAPLTLREQLGGAGGPGLLDRLTSPAVGTVRAAPDVLGYLDLALAGGFPEPALDLEARTRAGWYRDYVEQIASRDVVGVLRRAEPDRMRRYLEALALASAGVVEHRTLYEAAAISKRTAEGYDDVLRRLFVTVHVPAFSTNRLKNLVVRPKRYVVDAALLAAAARIGRPDIVRDGDLLGCVVDTFVHTQLRGEVLARHPDVRIAHLRSDGGRREVDLILDLGGRRVVAIEVKAGASVARTDARHLVWLRDELGADLVSGIVLHTGRSAFALDERIYALPICALWS